MEIKRDLLEKNGLHASILDESKNTFVNEDHSIRLWKAKTMDGWYVSIINNYGIPFPDDETDFFAERATKLFSGHVTTMKELNAALKACEFPVFKK